MKEQVPGVRTVREREPPSHLCERNKELQIETNRQSNMTEMIE